MPPGIFYALAELDLLHSMQTDLKKCSNYFAKIFMSVLPSSSSGFLYPKTMIGFNQENDTIDNNPAEFSGLQEATSKKDTNNQRKLPWVNPFIEIRRLRKHT